MVSPFLPNRKTLRRRRPDYMSFVAIRTKLPDGLSWWHARSEATSAEGGGSACEELAALCLSALVPDGEYAQGFKGWKTSVLPTDSDDGNAQHEKREKAGRVMLVSKCLVLRSLTTHGWMWSRVPRRSNRSCHRPF